MATKRRWGRVVFAAFALTAIGAIGAISYLRGTKDDAKILTRLPAGAHYAPNSAFVWKPWINIPWFGGQRLTYPSKSSLPGGFKPDPQASGVLWWEDPKPTASTASVYTRQINMLGPYIFSLGEWNDGGVAQSLQSPDDIYSAGYIKLPFVYGDSPRQFTVSYIDAAAAFSRPADWNYPILKMEVQLPPNHLASPALKERTFVFGKWTLVLKPLPRPGPSFLQAYSVSVLGMDRNESVLIDIDSPRNGLTPSSPRLRLQQGETCVCYLAGADKPIKAVIRRLHRTSQEGIVKLATAGSSAVGVSSSMTVTDSSGAELAKGFAIAAPGKGLRVAYLMPSNSNCVDLTLNGVSTMIGYTGGGTPLQQTLARVPMAAIPIKQGQKLQVVAYKQTEKAVGKIELTP